MNVLYPEVSYTEVSYPDVSYNSIDINKTLSLKLPVRANSYPVYLGKIVRFFK
jgi:hypothetical protein